MPIFAIIRWPSLLNLHINVSHLIAKSTNQFFNNFKHLTYLSFCFHFFKEVVLHHVTWKQWWHPNQIDYLTNLFVFVALFTRGGSALCELARDFHPILSPLWVVDVWRPGEGCRSSLRVVAHVFSWPSVLLCHVRSVVGKKRPLISSPVGYLAAWPNQ